MGMELGSDVPLLCPGRQWCSGRGRSCCRCGRCRSAGSLCVQARRYPFSTAEMYRRLDEAGMAVTRTPAG